MYADEVWLCAAIWAEVNVTVDAPPTVPGSVTVVAIPLINLSIRFGVPPTPSQIAHPLGMLAIEPAQIWIVPIAEGFPSQGIGARGIIFSP
jgi:hypothetical protein